MIRKNMMSRNTTCVKVPTTIVRCRSHLQQQKTLVFLDSIDGSSEVQTLLVTPSCVTHSTALFWWRSSNRLPTSRSLLWSCKARWRRRTCSEPLGFSIPCRSGSCIWIKGLTSPENLTRVNNTWTITSVAYCIDYNMQVTHCARPVYVAWQSTSSATHPVALQLL